MNDAQRKEGEDETVGVMGGGKGLHDGHGRGGVGHGFSEGRGETHGFGEEREGGFGQGGEGGVQVIRVEERVVQGGIRVDNGGSRVALGDGTVGMTRAGHDVHDGEDESRGDAPRHGGENRKDINGIDGFDPPSFPIEPTINEREARVSMEARVSHEMLGHDLGRKDTNGPNIGLGNDGLHGSTTNGPNDSNGPDLNGTNGDGPNEVMAINNGPNVGLCGPDSNGPIGPNSHGPIGPNGASRNAWEELKHKRQSIASMMRACSEDENSKLDFVPPKIMDNGEKVAVFTVDEITKASIHYTKQLYGYFIGTTMDFRAVQACARRLWRHFEFDSVAKNGAGFYFFKFKSEEGMNAVIENGPWLFDQVPLFLHKWEPGLVLEKVEPNSIPIWIQIHNVPLELWTGSSISKLASCVGKPCLMDRVTRETCSQKGGRLGYARVMVEIEATSSIPDVIKFQLPAINGRPERMVSLNVTYQWKPKHCPYCKVFGHTSSSCKANPIVIPDPRPTVATKEDKVGNDDGFTEVRAKQRGNKGKDKVVEVHVKPRLEYRPKPKMPTKPSPPKTAPKTSNPVPANKDGGKTGSPTQQCQLNTSNMFASLSDDDDDIEDVYEDDNPTARFMRLEDEYALGRRG